MDSAHAVHAVHADEKRHSRLFWTMDSGEMINVSKNLGLVTTSSTETEVVATGERFHKCTWFRFLRLSQGGNDKEDALMQDNQSCMFLHEYHPFSIGRGNKHINVRYFFVVDKIEKKEARMAHCPADKMIEGYITKPTQGTAFKLHRNTIMGISEEEYGVCKGWYREVLQRYELWDEAESYLMSL